MEVLGVLLLIIWIVAQIVAKIRGSNATEQNEPPPGSPNAPAAPADELRRFLESLSGVPAKPSQPATPGQTGPPPLPQQAQAHPPVQKAPAPKPRTLERPLPEAAVQRQAVIQEPRRRTPVRARQPAPAQRPTPPSLPDERLQAAPPKIDEAKLLREGLRSATLRSRQPSYNVARVGAARGIDRRLKGFITRAGLRRAIITREILGPPISLRKADSPPTP